MWREYKLTMDFVTELCGGVPRSDKVVEDWVRARAATEAALKKMPDARPLETVVAERVATVDTLDEAVDEAQQKIWVGFSRDAEGLFVRGANLRAHLKDCASVLTGAFKRGDVEGIKAIPNFRSKFVNALYVKEERLHILNGDGMLVGQATGHRDATMTVMTAQGQRTCLKRVDFVFPARIEATLQVFKLSEIEISHVKACLNYGCVHGFGQDRSLQFGRYTWKIDEAA